MNQSLLLKFSADDWGLSPGINEAISILAEKNVVAATSCMAGLPFVTSDLDRLLKTPVRLNIHFNLTYPHKNNFADRHDIKNLPGLIKILMLKKVSSQEINDEFNQQLDQLSAAGIEVSGIDGHHHIQLIPKVFHAIKKSLLARKILNVRTMADPQHLPSFLQSKVFHGLYKDLAKEFHFERHGYLLPADLNDREKLKLKVQKYSLLISHPSVKADFARYGIVDSMETERLLEYKFLRGLADE